MVFDRKAIANLFGVAFPSTNPILDRLVRTGILTRLRRDRYVLTEAASGQTRAIANELVKPSAISLWTALSDAGLTTQVPRSIQSVTPKRSATVDAPGLPSFEYIHLPAPLFFASSPDSNRVFRMSPEKALLDLLYVQKGMLDWESIDVGRLDRSLLQRLAGRFPERIKGMLDSSPHVPMNDQELLAMAKQQDVDPSTVLHEEREVQFLARIAEDAVLATHLAFKGGTAMRLVYLCDRYSDDLDFDLVRTQATPRQILEKLRGIASALGLETTDAWIKRRTILLEVRAAGWKRRLKIEISLLPRSANVPTVVRNVVTPVFAASVNILTYPLPVLLAGKMLAILERPYRTPRDLYDLFWLLSRNVEENAAYLRAAATAVTSKKLVSDRPVLYRTLLAQVETYADRQIATELGALLPRAQRRWASTGLKERTRELLSLRLAAMEA